MRATAHATKDHRLLNTVLAVGIIDALLLVVGRERSRGTVTPRPRRGSARSRAR